MRLRLVLAALAAVCLVAAVALARTTTTRLRAEPVTALGATVLADPHGLSLYRLKPETPRHLLCTSAACRATWPPLTVASRGTHVKLPAGARGPVTLLRLGRRFQVVVGGKPLYRFAGDADKGQANGQHIRSFGGVWSTLLVRRSASPAPSTTTPTTPGYGY